MGAGEAIYSSVPEPSPDLSDPKLAAWGCAFMLMKIQCKAAEAQKGQNLDELFFSSLQ